MTRGKPHIVGATIISGYRKYLEKDNNYHLSCLNVMMILMLVRTLLFLPEKNTKYIHKSHKMITNNKSIDRLTPLLSLAKKKIHGGELEKDVLIYGISHVINQVLSIQYYDKVN